MREFTGGTMPAYLEASGRLSERAARRLNRSLVFSATLSGSALVMPGVAAAASWLPARRAAARDPATVLRADV